DAKAQTAVSGQDVQRNRSAIIRGYRQLGVPESAVTPLLTGNAFAQERDLDRLRAAIRTGRRTFPHSGIASSLASPWVAVAGASFRAFSFAGQIGVPANPVIAAGGPPGNRAQEVE